MVLIHQDGGFAIFEVNNGFLSTSSEKDEYGLQTKNRTIYVMGNLTWYIGDYDNNQQAKMAIKMATEAYLNGEKSFQMPSVEQVKDHVASKLKKKTEVS